MKAIFHESDRIKNLKDELLKELARFCMEEVKAGRMKQYGPKKIEGLKEEALMNFTNLTGVVAAQMIFQSNKLVLDWIKKEGEGIERR